MYGVCCPKDYSEDYDDFGQDYYETRPVYSGPLFTAQKPWLQQPYGPQNIKTAMLESEEDFDEIDTVRQSLICGAGPAKSLNNDWHRVVGGADAVKNSWPFMVTNSLLK